MRYIPSMVSLKRHRVAVALLCVAGIYALVVYLLPAAFADSSGSSSDGTCTESQKVRLATGQHASKTWTVDATIEDARNCAGWMLGLFFSPQGIGRGSWNGAWEIAPGGHLSPFATVVAHDESESGDRAISGVVGANARSIVLVMSKGENRIIRPKLPSPKLLKDFGWLHGFRFFLYFYPSGSHVKKVMLRDANGHVYDTVSSEEGSFGFQL